TCTLRPSRIRRNMSGGGVVACVPPRRGMVDRRQRFRWPRQNTLIHCQLAVDGIVTEAGLRWSVGQPRAQPSGSVANYELVYPPSVSRPMIDTSFALTLSNAWLRNVICLQMCPQKITFRHFPLGRRTTGGQRPCPPLLDC